MIKRYIVTNSKVNSTNISIINQLNKNIYNLVHPVMLRNAAGNPAIYCSEICPSSHKMSM